MHNMTLDMNSHYLYPSQLIIPKEDTLVTTILGSCVSVCIYDKVKKMGGINHYMLPKWNGLGEASHVYGDYSIDCLIKKMTASGSTKENLIAKLFGGSSRTDTHHRVGQQNIILAKEKLANHSIKVVAENVGGESARKIIFCTQSGVVKMKYLNYKPTIE